MFFNLLVFEVKDRIYRVSTLVYFGIYGALAFLMGAAFAGAFKGASVSFGFSNKLSLNSPVVLNSLICLLGYIGLLVSAPIFGQSINKDFENKFSQILFATPIHKRTYFFVRYLGSSISSLVIFSSIAFGLWLVSLMPFIDRSLVSDQHFYYYLAPYLTNVIPNTLIFGAIFIALISLYKKMAPVYVASIAVFTGWMISQSLTADLENKFMAAMIEPFGLEAASQVTRYWSLVEQSTRVIPVTGVLLYNRLIWSGIGLVFLVFAYLSFNPFRLLSEKKKKSNALIPSAIPRFEQIKFPEINLFPHSFRVFLGLTFSEFKQAFSNLYFLMILLCGVIYIFAISGEANKIYGTETLPVTYMMLEVIGGNFGLFNLILTTFYAGELVWKDRTHHFFELVDSKPVPNLYLYLSKLFSLFTLQLFLSFVVLACCILIQTFHGYFHYEWAVYFKHLLIYDLPSHLMICVLALFIQTLARNKYVGHSILVFYYLLILWLPSLGFDHVLYLVGELPRAPYSDMNGFGTSFYRFSVLGVYWSFFYLGLSVLTVLFWKRGVLQSFRQSLMEFKRRVRVQHRVLLSLSVFGFIGFGAFIFYNTNILNLHQTEAEKDQKQVDYELKYKVYEKLPQPKVQSAKLQVDIFPETQSLKVDGTLRYKNKSAVPIKKILLGNAPNATLKVDVIEWSKPAKLIEEDPRLQFRIYELESPLLPGEELTLHYRDRIEPKGFSNDNFAKEIVQNGTFFHLEDFGLIVGYQPSLELSQDKTRRKYGLPERPRMHDVHDVQGLNQTYISNEGDWIDFEATVSTSSDQIALAPGYLEKEWTENGRRYFHYKMDRPILNFYAFLSARYEVTHDEWNGIKIEVYHHPDHTVDVPRMIKSVKKSLAYYTENFSPFQYRQFRIVEFPRYESFAQSFPNTVPYSEAVGFIAKVKENDPESVDYSFYITAHELGHQWWAHQVIGADVQGSTMLSESLAEYSSLMVQEKEYGPKQMRKFLKYTLDRYLRGRGREKRQELPLELNENQLYIHYQKGSLVFYALKDYLGEKVVNQVLKDFIRDYAFKGPPFPTAIDLVERFKKVTPPELQYLIQDLFETITFYDNQTQSVSYMPVNGKYKVTIVSQNRKYRTDGQGHETNVPMKDWIDVGLYDEKGELFYLKKHLFQTGQNQIELEVDQAPSKGGVDPLNKLIDRVSDDNIEKAKMMK